jgi:GNAT superfamily N-acetyltransferase
MQILDYDDIDPLGALHVSLLDLSFALTPERAGRLRRTDPRPLPCLAIYGVEDGTVIGQLGIFRLPMISTHGPEDVGGIWAVSTHPEFAGRDVVSQLLEEAHHRMRSAGLRFSMLGANRFRVDYRLYRRHGYVDMGLWATALASWTTAHVPTRLIARLLDDGGHRLIEQLFAEVAEGRLGFADSHKPFASLRENVSLDDIRILSLGERPVGYAHVHHDDALLNIHALVLRDSLDINEAVAALVTETRTPYVQLRLSRPIDITRLREAGWRVARPDSSALMVKPLVSEVTADDARQLFGIGTDQFLVSWLDLT